jgi:heptosyltransferase-2
MSVDHDPDAVARAHFLKMTPRKHRFVRMFESLARTVLPLFPPPPPATKITPRTILVIEYWNLGDLAILVPFLRALRRNYPGARISLLVNAAFASFLDGQDLVDEFIPVRVPWTHHNRWKKYTPFSPLWISFARALRALRARQFDSAFSGRMDVRDNFLLWVSNARRRIGYAFGGGGLFLTDHVAPDLSRPHRADIWLRLLGSLDTPLDVPRGGFRLADSDLASAKSFLAARGILADTPVIGIHPGARIATRRWGDDRFAEVARHLQRTSPAHILWFSEPGDTTEAPRLDRLQTVKADFRLFLAILSRCKLLVCNDSGPMHLANLLDVPVVAIFGPQNPHWFGPRGPRDKVVIRPEMWCRPCFDYCIYDQPYCLSAITPDEVISSVRDVLQQVGVDSPLVPEKFLVTVSAQRTRNV